MSFCNIKEQGKKRFRDHLKACSCTLFNSPFLLVWPRTTCAYLCLAPFSGEKKIFFKGVRMLVPSIFVAWFSASRTEPLSSHTMSNRVGVQVRKSVMKPCQRAI